MNARASRGKVLPFISHYRLKAEHFADSPDTYKSFNEFFYRKLKPGARPIAPEQNVAVFPADGRHLGFQNIHEAEGIFVKGAKFELLRLCGGNEELAGRYREGSIVLSRLCPVDYHRFHFPVSGTPARPVLINGALYSVNPLALKKNINYLTENKRYYTVIQSNEFGPVLMFEVGATCVGSVEFTFSPGVAIRKGDEKGYFKFGGSETILLFEPNRIQLAEDLLAQSKIGRELYAWMGDSMGKLIPRS
jgi:phosphatidylserine decarboxylase